MNKKIMKTSLKNTQAKINQLTSNIEANYPELYPFIDDPPSSNPNNFPGLIEEHLDIYLNTLKNQLIVYIENRSLIKEKNLL